MVTDVAADVTRLLRREVELARTEIRLEASKAVRGVRAVVMGAAALHLFAIVVSVGGVLALSEVLASRVPAWAEWSIVVASGVVAAVWLLIGVILLGTGRRRLRGVSPVPRHTIESLKEDIAWLRKPIG
jgi:hypothetical protein